DADLLNRLRLKAQNRTSRDAAPKLADHLAVVICGYRGISSLGVVDVDTVQGDIRLIGSGPRHIAFLSGTGLQTEQIRNIASFQRQLANLNRVENVAERSVLGVGDSVLKAGPHFNHLADCPDAHLYVGFGLLAD